MGWGGGWGDHAPETARIVAEAFYEGKRCRRGNCGTDGETYWLDGHAIARRIKPENVPDMVAMRLSGSAHFRRPLEFTWAGWPTKMTARHLNALGVRASVTGIKNPDTRFNGKPCNAHRWYTKEEIDCLPEAQPKKPPERRVRPAREEFVNLTLSLFA